MNRTHPLIYGPNGCYKESLTNGERYKRVRIAILDTGLAHPDGTEDVPQEVAENARRFVECQSYEALGLWSQDEDGHGTATATLALKVCPNAEICILKVLQKRGEGISREIVGKAICHAVKHGADVISISLGWHYDDETSLEQAIEYAKTSNVLVFAATSNDGNRENLGVMYPARALNVISVDPATGGGTTSDFKPPSNDRNNTKGYRFTAPGEDVLAAYPLDLESSGETRVTGASFATPIAAGVAALILEFARQLPLGLEPGIFNHLRRIEIMRDVIYEFCSETSDKETIFRFIRPWKKFAATHHYSGPYGGDSLDTSSYRWQLANKIIDILSERLGPSWRVGEKMHMEAQKLRIQNSELVNDMVDVEMKAL